MVKFAVQLKGQASALEMIAPCFQGDSVRTVRRDDQWFLESAEFEQSYGQAAG